MGHVSPEAAAGGLIGLVEEGDSITIDLDEGSITLDVDEAGAQGARRRTTTMPEPRVKSGYLARYAAFVSSADKGAVLS